MRLDELPTSDRIEDRRGVGTSRAGLGIGTIVVLGLIGWALGIDPRLLIGGAEILSGGGTQVQQPRQQPAGGQARRTTRPSDDIGRFVSITIGNINAVWTDIFQRDGQNYRKPTLVLYQNQT